MSISQRAAVTAMAPFQKRIVNDEDVEKALDWLRDSAAVLGEAKARVIKAASMVKHIEALEFLASNEKSADARKSYARTTVRYLTAITEEADAAGEYEKLRALREAASAKIEAWRSEQANYRSMKL